MHLSADAIHCEWHEGEGEDEEDVASCMKCYAVDRILTQTHTYPDTKVVPCYKYSNIDKFTFCWFGKHSKYLHNRKDQN